MIRIPMTNSLIDICNEGWQPKSCSAAKAQAQVKD